MRSPLQAAGLRQTGAGEMALRMTRACSDVPPQSALAVLLFAWLRTAGARTAAGLFDGMAGAWRGEGSIAWTTGETERMRCNAKYEVERDGNRIMQNLTCATDSTRLVVKSTITLQSRCRRDHRHSGARRATASTATSPARASTGNVKALVKSTDNRFSARVNVVDARAASRPSRSRPRDSTSPKSR